MRRFKRNGFGAIAGAVAAAGHGASQKEVLEHERHIKAHRERIDGARLGSADAIRRFFQQTDSVRLERTIRSRSFRRFNRMGVFFRSESSD
jgi:hypothetical protein